VSIAKQAVEEFLGAVGAISRFARALEAHFRYIEQLSLFIAIIVVSLLSIYYYFCAVAYHNTYQNSFF
jgi:hypothetical protein